MSLTAGVEAWLHRIRGLGLGRVLLLVAILLVLIALATPVWYLTLVRTSAAYSTTDFTWTSTNTNAYDAGTLEHVLIQPYSAPGFNLHSLAAAISASYILFVILAIVLAVVFILYSLPVGRRLSNLGHLMISLVVVVFALLALLYPIVGVPPPAGADLGIPAISGFFGSGAVTGGVNPPDGATGGAATASWGAGLGWWLVLGAVILGLAGAMLPYLRSVSRPSPPPPAEWRPRD